jgi:tight adherence protein C
MAASNRDQPTEIVSHLHEAVDLLIASLESGATLDEALRQYRQEEDNELSQAFGRALDDIASGVGRRAAMRNMAEQIDVPEVTEFVESLIRADEKGISIVDTLKEIAPQR